MGAAALAALLGLGCGSVLRSASYTGTSLPVIVSAANVTTADVPPDGHDIIGRVESECTERTGEKRVEVTVTTDPLCSESSLDSDLRRRASAEGGSVLVGFRCIASGRDERETRKKDDGKDETYVVTLTERSCTAEVARPRPPEPPRLVRPDPPSP